MSTKNEYQQIKRLNIVPERARQAAGFIRTAFYWSSTNEGGDFWKGVCDKLDGYAKWHETTQERTAAGLQQGRKRELRRER